MKWSGKTTYGLTYAFTTVLNCTIRAALNGHRRHIDKQEKPKIEEIAMAVEYFDAPARSRLGTGFIQTLVRAIGGIGRAKAAEHTFNRLSNMSDAGLASRGIWREDISQFAIQQLLGRNPTQSGF